MPIQIYAELLSNIRQISIVASLPSAVDASTSEATVESTTGASVVQVRHDGESRALRLPGKTTLAAGRLPMASQGTTLSWRLPLPSAAVGRDALETEVPWSADDLTAEDELLCKTCRFVVMERGKIWKDLPSENWAEMMEFWHCHKPDHKHDSADGQADDAALAARGYGANSVIMAQVGVGLVDLTSFLLSKDDCSGLMYARGSAADGSSTVDGVVGTTSEPLHNLHVSCSSCSAQLGYYNFRAAAVTLFKWMVSLSGLPHQPDVYGCLALTLATTMARSGSSKALVMPILQPEGGHAAGDRVLHTWILNSRIHYSSTDGEGTVPAVKLLYRVIERGEADRMLGSFVDDVPEVDLPTADLTAVVDELGRTNALLPPGERTFKEWTVGLLTRWQAASSPGV